MGLLSNIFGKKAKATDAVVFEVSLSCDKCVSNVENMLSSNKGIVSTKVDLASKTVSLEYDNTITNEEILQSSIERLGFEVSKQNK